MLTQLTSIDITGRDNGVKFGINIFVTRDLPEVVNVVSTSLNL